MNTVFNFNRFLCLCKREFTEGRVQWLRWYGVLAAGLFFVFFTKEGDGLRMAFLVVVSVASAVFIQGISGRQKRVFYLTIPASALEKLLSRYVYITSLIFVAFFAAALTAKVGQQLFSHFVMGSPFDWSFSPGMWKVGEDSDTVLAFFTLQAIFMFGSMVWLKNSFFKTSLFHVVFGTALLVTILMWMALFSHPNEMYLSEESGEKIWIKGVIYAVHIGMLVFYYVLCYFRFRELGIVHKLLPLSPTLRLLAGCYLLLLVSCILFVTVGISYLF